MNSSRQPTAFENRVYTLCKKITKGQVMTYGEMAKILKSSPRAVGQALKNNPYAPVVPCHRVIKSDGTLGGYNGVMHSKKKLKMLKSEGITFKNGIIVERNKQKVQKNVDRIENP
jgi:methylated-DNA-[protein]-cysteine S-methyltransferase